MTSVDEITKQFIATYYNILCHPANSPPLFQMYNSHAQISRKWPNNENTSYSFKLVNDPSRDVCPDDLKNSKVTVSSYNGTKVNDNILINVYGEFIQQSTFLQGYWVQEFVLQRYEARWFIINDNFFSFTRILPKLIGAEAPFAASPMPQPQQVFAPKHIMPSPQSFQPQNVSNSFGFSPQPVFNPAPSLQPVQAPPSTPPPNPSPSLPPRSYSTPYRGDRRSSSYISKMDPDRSITVNLNTKYNGDNIAEHYFKYGDITDKFYTHGAVILEFRDQKSKEAALNAPPPVVNGITAKVENGLPKTYSRGRPR